MHSTDFFFSSHQKVSAELVLGRDAEQAEQVPNRDSNLPPLLRPRNMERAVS
jgi:hypothetical protein